MNQIYRTIWNAARGLWQVASELGSHQGKSHRRTTAQVVAGSLLIVSLGAQAELPTQGQVVAGQGSIAQNGNAMTIQQSSQNMAINWKSFSIGQDNSVRFVQPSASSAVLNRVTGNQVSEIRGKLSANGKVFLVNPNGVLFSQTAKVDVGALVASTLDISPSDFMAGNYQFSGTASNAVINQGNIVAAEGGFVAMIAAKIINTGAITTPKGSTLMGAGSTVTLDLGGPVKLEVNQATLETYIEQGGAIKADGGFVYLTAKAADALTSSVINHTGLTQAQSLSTNDQGEIVLLGDMQSGQLKVAGTLDASAPNGGDGGFIETSAAKVQIADNTAVTTQAQSGKTGEWLIDPTDFNIDAGSATQTASGMGADTLSSNLDTNNVTLTTSATNTGSELGDINVNAAVSWASNTTLTLNAHHDININAPITATGANAGLALNYGGYIQNSGTVAADTNYHVNAPVTLSGANASFAVNGQNYTLLHSQANLDAAKDTSGNYYALGNDVTLTGIYPDSVLGNFSGTLAGLGHTVEGLVIEQTDTSSTTDVGFISQLTSGVVRDMGLSDIQVTNHSTSSNSRTGGLVGQQNSGDISNSDVSGAVTGDYYYVGGLVGFQSGNISNSYASGAVTGTSNSYYVGGLVGDQSSGNISNSYASAAVSGGNFVGGLVGIQYQGTISNSYASGAVTGTSNSYYVGGLVGFQWDAISNSYASGAVSGETTVGGLAGYQNSGTISNSYASGAVSGDYALGGLVAIGYPNAISDSYYATTNAAGDSINNGGEYSGNGNGSPANYTDLTDPNTFTGWDTNIWTFPTQTGTAVAGYGIAELPYLTQVTAQSERTLFNAGLGTEDSPYQISNWQQLQNINYNDEVLRGGHYYQLSNDLDNTSAGYQSLASTSANGGNGWQSIGLYPFPPSHDVEFSGYFDGQNFSLANLNINRPTEVGVGLFGAITATSWIQNLAVVDASVQGQDGVGILVGYNWGTIEQISTSGQITGHGNYVGGLVGYNNGNISNSYSASSVTNITGTSKDIGGLVGTNVVGANIVSSYATGQVTGVDHVGGLVGANSGSIQSSYASGRVIGQDGENIDIGGLIGLEEQAGSISNSYYATTDASGTSQDAAYSNSLGEGRTYAQLTTQDTFNGWDISAVGGDSRVWRIYEGNSTPLLRGFLIPMTVSTNSAASSQVYDGTTALQSPPNLQWSAVLDNNLLLGSGLALGSKNVGSQAINLDYYSTQNGYDLIVDNSLSAYRVNVTPRALSSVSGITAADKVYDGTAVATLNTQNAVFTGLLGSDQVTLSGSGQFSSANVGNRSVDFSGMSLAGAAGSNYSLVGTNFSPVTAAITARPVQVLAQSASKRVGSSDPLLTYLTSCGGLSSDCGLVAGESLVGQLQRTAGEAAGRYQIGQGSVTNANNPNYDISFQSGLFRILANSVPQRVDNTIAALERQNNQAQVEAPAAMIAQLGSPSPTGDEQRANLRFVSNEGQIPTSHPTGELYVVGGGIQTAGVIEDNEDR